MTLNETLLAAAEAAMKGALTHDQMVKAMNRVARLRTIVRAEAANA
jgi:hypothetical protein